MSNNILVIADPGPDDTLAVEKAREFIDDSSAQVTILTFVDNSGVAEKSMALAGHQAIIKQAAEKSFGDLSNVEFDVIATPDIGDYCAEFCDTQNIDLVVKTGHRSESVFYTPLDWQLLRKLNCSLVIAAEHQHGRSDNILVAVDILNPDIQQQNLNENVLAWSAGYAATNNANLHLAYCIEAEEPLTQADINTLVSLEEKSRPEIEPGMRQLLDRQQVQSKSILISAGAPEIVLPRLADQLQADLVIMGSIGRSGLGAMLLGNTAEKVMHKLRSNLAVIHLPPGQAAN